MGAWDQFEKLYRERVEPTKKTTKGMGDRQLLRSTENPDEGMSITVWETHKDLLDYEQSELRQNLAKDVEDLYRGQFWVKHFEVTDASSN